MFCECEITATFGLSLTFFSKVVETLFKVDSGSFGVSNAEKHIDSSLGASCDMCIWSF